MKRNEDTRFAHRKKNKREKDTFQTPAPPKPDRSRIFWSLCIKVLTSSQPAQDFCSDAL